MNFNLDTWWKLLLFALSAFVFAITSALLAVVTIYSLINYGVNFTVEFVILRVLVLVFIERAIIVMFNNVGTVVKILWIVSHDVD